MKTAPETVLTEGWFEPGAVEPLGDGHIHETYRVRRGDGDRFVLQRINRRVFTDPVQVMRNIERVTAHVSAQAAGLIPALIHTRSGAGFHTDEQGHLWRMWTEVTGTRVVTELTEAALAEAAGAAFGRFQQALETLPPPALAPVIPGFHELAAALRRLDRATPLDRTAWDIDAALIDSHRGLTERLSASTGHIHGDCKLNNLLFDEALPEVRAVLDLDTVMLGHWAWDYGDLVRSVLTATGRGMQPRMLAAVTRGFLASSGKRATAEFLLEAPRYMTFMLGVRYLTDHCEGDGYFKVAEHGDNLQRARRQFDLLKSIEADAKVLTEALKGVEGVVG